MNIRGISIDWIRSTLESMETPEQTHKRKFKEKADYLIAKYEHERFKEEIKLCGIILDDINRDDESNFINEDVDEVLVKDNIIDKYISSDDNKLVAEKEREIKILIDTKTYGRKPSKNIVEEAYMVNGVEKKIYEPGMVNIRLVNNQVSITVSQLIDEIMSGKSFTLAAFKTGDDGKLHRTKACWESQDLLALDFDDGITPEEFLAKSEKLNLKPTFMYASFSDTPEKRKFRAVYVLKERLYDYRDANTCTLALMELFKECDKACKDPNRLYYGGRNIIYEDHSNMIDPYQLLDAYCYSLVICKDNSNYKRNIRLFCSKVALNLENGLPKKNVVKVPSSISIYRGRDISDKNFFEYASSEEEVRKNCIYSEESKCKKIRYCINDEKVKRKVYKDIDLNEIKCPLWRMFFYGTIYPFDDEFMHICLNLLSVEGGEKAVRRAIDNMPHATDEIKKMYKQKLSYFKSQYQIPSRCEGYCPRFTKERKRVEMDEVELNRFLNKECENKGYNILHSIDNKRGNIRMINQVELISIEEAREELEQLFSNILNDNNLDAIHVIKGDTGIGKTEVLKSIGDFRNMVIAYPNHRLGSEIFDRLSIEDAIYMKDINISDERVLAKYRYYQSIGYYKESYRTLDKYRQHILNKEFIDGNEEEMAKKEAENIKNHIENLQEFRLTTRPILCTHSRLLNLNNKNVDTYIIDEDIVPTLCPSIKLDLHKITVLEKMAIECDAKNITNSFRTIKSCITSAIENTSTVIQIPTIHYDKREVNKIIEANSNSLDENIIDILSVKFVKCDNKGNVLGIIKKSMPNGKVIIMSATANEAVYKELFKKRKIIFHEIKHIKPIGKLILHYGGYSRSYFNKNIDKVIKTIKEEVAGINNVITFKKYKHHFEKEGFNVIATYGSCTGLDEYKGKDLIVVGTPYCNDSYYKLMAALINKEAQIVSSSEYQNVKRNGFEFYINTFNAELENAEANLLREIQYYFIETELVQAVGRARIVSNDVTVHYFASYPLVGSELAM